MGEKSFLKISGIRKSFGSGENRTEVLKGIDFEVAKGEFCSPQCKNQYNVYKCRAKKDEE